MPFPHQKITLVRNLKNKKCNLILFSIGGICYAVIELLWRGRTHWSMMIAGGISFLGLSKISKRLKNSCLFIKALAGSAFITAVEFIFGLLFNIILKRKVWDYSHLPFNLCGQICALYSFFWLILSFISIPISDKIMNKMR